MPTSPRDRLIGRIYDTLLEPGDWTELLESIAEWTGTPAASGNAELSPVDGLVEHLERAVRSSSHLHTLEDQNQLLSRLYHAMPWPMLMLGDELCVISCNTAARQSLGQDSSVQLLPDDRLALRDSSLRQELRNVIAMTHGRQPRVLTSSDDGVTLLCIPFGKSDAQGDISRVRTIVWVLAARDVVIPEPEALRSIFRISHAESRLLHLLCRVGNLNQCAKLLGLSVHTVRAQLKSTMTKVGVNSQVQLVSQAMGHSLLHASQVPSVSAAECTLTLDDGRVLSWYEYGSPKGRPVLSLENIGSSIPDHAPHDHWYRERGLRVIVVVRPGYGVSTYRPDYQFHELGPDLKALCRHLRIERPAIAAYCCGGAYALSAAALDPWQFERVGVLASTVPIEHFELDKLDRLHRLFLQLFRRDPRLFTLIGKLALRGVHRAPEKYFRFLAKGLGTRDQELLANPELLRAIIQQQQLRHFQGGRMVIDEYLHLQHPWQADLGSIRTPTLVWHGEDDAVISIGSARSMAAAIPTARFRALPGQGHFLVYEVWREFLAELLEWPGEAAARLP